MQRYNAVIELENGAKRLYGIHASEVARLSSEFESGEEFLTYFDDDDDEVLIPISDIKRLSFTEVIASHVVTIGDLDIFVEEDDDDFGSDGKAEPYVRTGYLPEEND